MKPFTCTSVSGVRDRARAGVGARFATFAAAAAVACLPVIGGGSSLANAAPAATVVNTEAEFVAALGDSSVSEIQLGATVTVSGTAMKKQNAASLTIDLNDRNLNVDGGYSIGAGNVLTVKNSKSSGAFNLVNIGPNPAIETTGATLNVESGYVSAVHAVGTVTGAAVIGGKAGQPGGTVNVSGGTLHAEKLQGTSKGAVIGGGEDGVGGTINVTGGRVDALNQTAGAAIGGGVNGDGGTINISGGEVLAASDQGFHSAVIGGGENGSSGDITISGGKVNVSYLVSKGAGIGSGAKYQGDPGKINISGGEVRVNNSTNSTANVGIGSGWENKHGFGEINISGGDISVVAGKAGIGIGDAYALDGAASVLNISGGNIKAYGSDKGYSGIGQLNFGTSTASMAVNITGGKVLAVGGDNAAGIGGSHDDDGLDVNISGNAEVTAVAGAKNGKTNSANPVGFGAYNTNQPAFGSLSVTAPAVLRLGSDMLVPAGVTVEGNGRIAGLDAIPFPTIKNLGVIEPFVADKDAPGAGLDDVVTVTDNAYTVTAREAWGGSPKQESVRVYAPTMTAGARELPDLGRPYVLNTKADETGDTFTRDTVLTADTELYAFKDPVRMSFDMQGAGNVKVVDTPRHTEFVSFAVPFRAGYEFKGWYTEPTGGVPFVFTGSDAKEDTTVYARWGLASPHIAITGVSVGEGVQGSKAVVSGSGFVAGSELEFSLHSDPVVLGRANADVAGNVFFEFVVPDSVAPGAHTLRVASLLNAQNASTAFTVNARVPDLAPSAAPSPAPRPSGALLPSTGSGESVPGGLTGLAVLAALTGLAGIAAVITLAAATRTRMQAAQASSRHKQSL